MLFCNKKSCYNVGISPAAVHNGLGPSWVQIKGWNQNYIDTQSLTITYDTKRTSHMLQNWVEGCKSNSGKKWENMCKVNWTCPIINWSNWAKLSLIMEN